MNFNYFEEVFSASFVNHRKEVVLRVGGIAFTREEMWRMGITSQTLWRIKLILDEFGVTELKEFATRYHLVDCFGPEVGEATVYAFCQILESQEVNVDEWMNLLPGEKVLSKKPRPRKKRRARRRVIYR